MASPAEFRVIYSKFRIYARIGRAGGKGLRHHTIHVTERSETSGSAVKSLRRSGLVPAVLSRSGQPALNLAVDRQELITAAHKTGVGGVMQLLDESKGEKHLGILKELQWEPLSKKVTHAAFQEVNTKQVVTTSVPVQFVGEPTAVADKSGQFLVASESVDVHGKVSDLPDMIAVDISGLQIGDVVTAGDIVYPDGCEPAHPSTVICSLTVAKMASIETPETEAVSAEVPVVGEDTTESEGE